MWIRKQEQMAWMDSTNAVLPITDRGFQYGDGLFETLRIYDGKMLDLNLHLERLWNSQLALGFGLSLNDFQEFRVVLERLTKENGIKEDGVAKLIISRGEGVRGYAPPEHCTPTIVIQANTYQPLEEAIYQNGYSAILCTEKVFSGSASTRHKTLSGIDKVMARMEVTSAGADEGLLINERGQITEAISSNLFVVGGDYVKTSPISCGLLPGVTRSHVVHLLRDNGFSVLEAPVTHSDMRAANDVWITNSVLGIMRLRSVHGLFQGDLSEEYYRIRRLYSDFIIHAVDRRCD